MAELTIVELNELPEDKMIPVMFRSLPGVGESYMTGWDAYIDGGNTTVCWEKKRLENLYSDNKLTDSERLTDFLSHADYWIDNQIKLFIRRKSGSTLCDLFVRIRTSLSEDFKKKIDPNGEESYEKLSWVMLANSGSMSEPNEGIGMKFSKHFKLDKVRYSRATLRSIVMMKVFAQRAKKNLCHRT